MILNVAAAALLAAVAMTFIQAGALKEIVRFAAGLMITIALLSPLSKLQFPSFQRIVSQGSPEISRSIEQAAQQRESWMLQSASREIQAYISGRLREHGISCTVEVEMEEQENGNVALKRVVLSGIPQTTDAQTVQNILTSECGIAKEQQSYVETNDT